MKKTIIHDRKIRRKKRVTLNIRGTGQCPRISIYRSNKCIYAQAIDDEVKRTLCSSDSRIVKAGKKTDKAFIVGQNLAELLKGLKVQKAVFDRGLYAYQGRVKRLAEGLRDSGVQI